MTFVHSNFSLVAGGSLTSKTFSSCILDPFVEFVAGVIVNSKVSLGELSVTGEEEFLEIDTDLLCQFISSEYLRLDFADKIMIKTKEIFQG